MVTGIVVIIESSIAVCRHSYHRPVAGLQKVDSGASAASGQTQISWTNVYQNHVYFVLLFIGVLINSLIYCVLL